MAERKPKAKARRDDSGVLASLPSTRPQRIGGRRRGAAKPAAAKATAKRKPAAAKPKAKRSSGAARSGGARSATGKAKAKARAVPITTAAAKKPKPVRSGASGLAEPAQKSATKRAPASRKPPSGTELVTTVVQAAGELAQVGLSIGGQVLKRAVERLPKP
jgi:hypothetical protein